MNAAVPNRKRFKEEVHRPPFDDPIGSAVEQVDYDRDRNSERSEEQRCIQEKHRPFAGAVGRVRTTAIAGLRSILKMGFKFFFARSRKREPQGPGFLC